MHRVLARHDTGTLPIRLVSPPLFLFASLNYFLPHTAHNLSLYYQELEARHLPSAVKEQRESLVGSMRGLWGQSEAKVKEGVRVVEGGWSKGLERVERETGLRVGGEKEGKAV